MNVSGRTKDNDKARRDITLYCWHKDLYLKSQGNGKLQKPNANYTITKDEMSHDHEIIEVEGVSTLHDLGGDPEELKGQDEEK